MSQTATRLLALLRLAAACGVLLVGSLLHARPALELHPTPQQSESVELDKAPSEASYAIEVMVLHATNSGKGIDKRVGDMPELQKPPFSAYDSYQLLAKKQLPLEKGSPKTYRLPNGRTLKTELKEQPGPDTFKISASINQPKGKAFLPLLEVRAGLGQSFIVAGQTYQAGILVLVLKVIKG